LEYYGLNIISSDDMIELNKNCEVLSKQLKVIEYKGNYTKNYVNKGENLNEKDQFVK
jgi:hypothetical protein